MSKIYTKPPSFFEHNPFIIIKYLAIFFAALLLLASCSPSKNISSSGDYTKNKSRTTAQRSSTLYKKPSSRIYSSKKKPVVANNSSSSIKSRTTTKSSASSIKKSSTKSAYAAPKATSSATAAVGVRSAIVSYAEKFIGIKYEYGGRDANGFDCSGFTCHVMKKFNLPLPPTSTTQYINGSKISWNKAETGDLIFFGKGGNVSHVGIVTNNTGIDLFVIHSTSSKGVCIDEIRHNNYWRPRIIGAASYVNQPTFNARSIGK